MYRNLTFWFLTFELHKKIKKKLYFKQYDMSACIPLKAFPQFIFETITDNIYKPTKEIPENNKHGLSENVCWWEITTPSEIFLKSMKTETLFSPIASVKKIYSSTENESSPKQRLGWLEKLLWESRTLLNHRWDLSGQINKIFFLNLIFFCGSTTENKTKLILFRTKFIAVFNFSNDLAEIDTLIAHVPRVIKANSIISVTNL